MWGMLPAQKLWSDVRLDRSSTYLGQPVKVRITVYTSTWFTRGVDLGNIKVNGAFTVYFRPVSRTLKIDGQTYAAVEQVYNVFPYSEDDIVFPSLDIEVETPPEGEYKGVVRKLKSAEKQIRVKPVPPNFDEGQWLVATGMQVGDNWSGDRQEVKVGDVLQRRITRTAYNTVSELIPPIAWDSLPGVSLYPARSEVRNNKTKTAFSATRTETMRYLFEKEGKVTIPEMVFTWYHPYQQRLYKRTLKEVTFDVQPNPDLGMLESIRDSLAAQQAAEASVEAEEEPFTILGLTLKQFLIAAALAIAGAYLLFLFLRGTIRFFKKRRERYRNSEAFFFRQFEAAVRRKDRERIVRTLYRWIDELKLPEPSLFYFAKTYGSAELAEAAANLENRLTGQSPSVKVDLDSWKEARRNYLQRKSENTTAFDHEAWINPVRIA